MKQLRVAALVIAGTALLGGCTETQFADAIGAGKSSPDESGVRVNQALTLPPDLRLNPPPETTSEDDGQANTVATRQPLAQPVTATPSDVDEAEPAEPVTTASTDPTTSATKAATPPAAAPTPPTAEDAYQRYGISKTNPDGTPKPQGVLDEELRQAQIAEKRKSNPGYGTIWNMGDLWSDN